MKGICYGIQTFFNSRGLANSDIVLTWDPVSTRVDTRRNQACGSSYCTPAQTQLQTTIGDRNIAISCDEFPFAGTEEGGNYYTTLPNNPTNAQKTCVPAWQNSLQGNCNSEFGSSKSPTVKRGTLIHLIHLRDIESAPNKCGILRTSVERGQFGELCSMEHWNGRQHLDHRW